MTEPRRPRLSLDHPLESVPAEPRRHRRHANPYEGAPTRQFNTRLLLPLHERYARLARRLEDEGFDTTVTEIVHALLHEGPTDLDETEALVRRWRRARTEEA